MKAQDIVIVGCGRLGAMLAHEFSVEGHRVAIIDKRKEMFEKLNFDFGGFTIVGDATEFGVLKHVITDETNYVFACTSQDNTNLMVAQVARDVLGVKQVVARVYDPNREALYADLGVPTINPTTLSARQFMNIVHHAQKDAKP